MTINLNMLRAGIISLLDSKFKRNESMTNISRKGFTIYFWNTEDPKVKISVTLSNNLIGENATIEVNVVIQDPKHPDYFIRLSECTIDSVTEFERDLNLKIPATGFKTGQYFRKPDADVLEYVEDLCKVL